MWLVLSGLLLTFLYVWLRKKYSHWSKNGIPGPTPVPLIGNFGQGMLGKKSNGELITEFYRKYQDYPFVGLYRNVTPLLLIRDPDFIKNILLRDFSNFHDNDIEIDKELDPIFGRNPFCMKGVEWKHKRAQLTACFTSGKIKGMYNFLDKSSKRMVQFIEDETKTSTHGLEAREISIRFTIDNVAACAFGVEGKCFDEPCSDFRDLAEKFLSADGPKKYLFVIFAIWPDILKYFKIKFVSQEVEDRIFDVVLKSLKYRKENNIVRNDFLDVLNNLPTENGSFKDIDIVAHAASFFGDGYETSSRVMSFLLFELASNLEIQEKLRNEINDAADGDESLKYETVQSLQFLDACLHESMRLNSVLHAMNKVCTKDYTYTPTNPEFKKLSVTLKAGDPIVIPLEGLQMDPKYFADPETYNPERFLSKEGINKFTFLPFGEGPRVCLGQRFAQTQIKAGVAHIIKHYKLTVNSKTQLPLKYDPFYFMRHVIGGMWIDFEKIE